MWHLIGAHERIEVRGIDGLDGGASVMGRSVHMKIAKKYSKPRARRTLYPAIRPYRKGFLRVSELHEIYFEESGNRRGKPVIFLHGGPGGGTEAKMRRFFDPRRYRIVLFDQRGCGKSRPHASLVDNTAYSTRS